jgi:OOP family OmpA-OmpF porin
VIALGIALLTTPLFESVADPKDEQEGEEGSGHPVEVGLFVGALSPDRALMGTRDPGAEPTVGLRVGSRFALHWNWFVDTQFSSLETRTFAGDVDWFALRGGVEWLIQPDRRAEPFVSFGWGHQFGSFENASDYDSGFASIGLGQLISVGAKTRLRWEVRMDQTLAADGLRGEDLTQSQATIGVQWRFGKGPNDIDRDGVLGHRDRCPQTPTGARVDERGCPSDRDGDQVWDGIDLCPETLAGWTVGPDGCPLDADGDSVGDKLDRCPATPAGVQVDEEGCAMDADGDGVSDGLDRCPNTLKGIEVDASGCFLDADEDGVYDGLEMDRCPGTPKGTKVDRFGCPVDG